MEGFDKEYYHLRDVIHQAFTPPVLGREVLKVEHSFFKLTTNLALDDPVKSTSFSFSTLEDATSVLPESVLMGNEIAMADHVALCQAVKVESVKRMKKSQQQLRRQLTEDLLAPQCRTHYCIVKGNASGWLSVLPLGEKGYNFSTT